MRNVDVCFEEFSRNDFVSIFIEKYRDCCDHLNVRFVQQECDEALERAEQIFLSIMREDLGNATYNFGDNITIRVNDTKFDAVNVDNNHGVIYRKGFLFFLADKDFLPQEMRFLDGYPIKDGLFDPFVEFVSSWVASIAFHNVYTIKTCVGV